MSISAAYDLPGGETDARASAKEAIWRLAAAAFGHPEPELQEAIAAGKYHEAFNAAWVAVTGRPWPVTAPSEDFAALESGFIKGFLHGRKGKPSAPLLAGDYEHLLAGHARPVFMLNIAAFYKHFGLKAADGDEGRTDEPDHLASMLEFMAVLAHLEAGALRRGADPSAYRRAQRDFLYRYLAPLLEAVAGSLRQDPVPELDQTIALLAEELPVWARGQIAELEARVGPFRDPDASGAANTNFAERQGATRVVDQNLWG